MVYSKQTWVDGPAGATPINAARLNHMEDGIEAAGTGGGGGTDAEIVRDTIGTALVEGTGIDITVNDGADTITVATTAVLPTRTISTTAPLSGGGDLSANRTLSVAAASDTAAGVVELATNAEAVAGTDTARAVTPAAGAAAYVLQADAITLEATQDEVAAMFTGGTHTGISFAYDDTGAKVNATVSASGYTDEQVRDTMAAALVAGSNVTITPNDGADTITIAAATDAEVVRDTIGTALVAGTNVTITPNDGADTITIAASGSGGSTAQGGYSPYLMPSTAVAVTHDRMSANLASQTLTSGTRYMVAVALAAGTVVNAVNVRTNGYSGNTNSWAGLFDASRVCVAISANDTTGTVPSGNRTFTLGSAYTVPTSGLYYVGVMHAGGTPTAFGLNASANAHFGIPPIVSGTSNTGETTPPAVSSTANAITSANLSPYAWLT